jgi:hypothetical protein
VLVKIESENNKIYIAGKKTRDYKGDDMSVSKDEESKKYSIQ